MAITNRGGHWTPSSSPLFVKILSPLLPAPPPREGNWEKEGGIVASHATSL